MAPWSRHILECLRGRHAQPQGAVYSLKCIHNISTQHWISTVCVCVTWLSLIQSAISGKCINLCSGILIACSVWWCHWPDTCKPHWCDWCEFPHQNSIHSVLGSRLFGFETFKRPYSSYLMVISLKYIAFLDFLDCFAEQNLLLHATRTWSIWSSWYLYLKKSDKIKCSCAITTLSTHQGKLTSLQKSQFTHFYLNI